MNKIFLPVFFCLLSVLAFSACSDELEFPEESTLTGGEWYATLDFGFKDFEKVNVTTRSTLDEGAESRVHNVFVFLFSNGKRIFGKFYDISNRLPENTDLKTQNKDCWWVKNKTSAADRYQTNGQICMRAPGVTNARLYMFANIDADMVNISPEQLNVIQTEQQLIDLTAKMNQQTISRNGYFPMSVMEEGVNIDRSGISKMGGAVKTYLQRLDAKIQFYFQVAAGQETVKPENGKSTITQKLKAFQPESWRVVNVPKGSYVMPRAQEYDTQGYFNTEPSKFETTDQVQVSVEETDGQIISVPTERHGFSFYMLENREQVKMPGCISYHDRDKRIKDDKGRYDTSEGMWVYAPEEGTYLEVKGRVIMEVDVSSEAAKQQLEADVKYYIHLGDLTKATGSMDNFSVERNTFYTYTVTIRGVNSIEVEVETSKDQDPAKVEELEPGATGMVYVARESVYTFDAHYGQRVFCFDAAYIVPEMVTWYVKTPFGREGIPDKVGDTEVPSGMDYKWVHFYLNPVDERNTDPIYKGTNKPYSHNNQPYPGDQYKKYDKDRPWLMNVVEFTKFIKYHKRRLDDNQENAFRKEFDQEWFDWYKKEHPNEILDKMDQTQPWWRDRIYMTVYVDEFYYDADPITGEVRQDLWKEFTNQPNRLMHILCDSNKSLDSESTTTGSVVTLRQQSIQTPYNLEKDALKTAWGCECVDETEGYLWFYRNDERYGDPNGGDGNSRPRKDAEGRPLSFFGNSSMFNGAYNTAKLWGLLSNNTFNSNVRWDKYLNYSAENDHSYKDKYENECLSIFLKDQYAVMQYAAMMRNRDNNGNGKIDPEEVRWYIASIDQLYGIYMGQQGISEVAAVYSKKKAALSGTIVSGPYAGAHRWRYHVVSSTAKDGDAFPIELWAEEGVSVSGYKMYTHQEGSRSPYAIRCVRNLGLDTKKQFGINTGSVEEENVSIPEKLIKVNKKGNDYYFDLSNLNSKSLRFYTSHELEPQDEFSEMSMLYKGFRTGPIYNLNSKNDYSNVIKNKLESGYSPVADRNFRVPNVREGALMSLYCTDDSWWKQGGYIYVSSFYSNGLYGFERTSWPSWQFARGFASINTTQAQYVRSVCDWKPN